MSFRAPIVVQVPGIRSALASRITSGAAKPAPAALLTSGDSFQVIWVIPGIPNAEGLPATVF